MVWTLRQVGGSGVRKSPALDNIGENTNENGGFFSKDSRVISLEWGPRGYFLWSSEQNNLPSQPSCFIEMPLYRSGVLSNANQSEATRMAMVGYDRVLVLGGVDGTGREVLDWQQLLIPIEYIFHNWPPEFIAVNDQVTSISSFFASMSIVSVHPSSFFSFAVLSLLYLPPISLHRKPTLLLRPHEV